jgi:4-hydroxy-3-polyprenylbenzoate decarboxylase
MAYNSLEACLIDLEKHNHLIRIKEEVDPYLEMAAIHLRVYEANGPAILFENVKGSKFRAASNIFGSLERSKFIFRDTFSVVQQLIELKGNPMEALKHPLKNISAGFAALKALPLKNPLQKPVLAQQINITDIPLIHHWPMDGGAFVTLPQVYTEDVDAPGIMKANMGMYRIQLTGNDYITNKEIGLHYQLHRGIGVHQTKANKKGLPLKVSCFVGGPPSHTLSAVMPLPEGIGEATFAGVLGGRRFRYTYQDGFAISTDADFVITGEVYPGENKPEGPFGDHLGYYSLQHNFPLMKVHKVYARKNAIWPFTVVGRPPQEDTSFGQLIHELTGAAVPQEIPGVKEVHAVDAAGVHPLLLAIGSERYTPFSPTKQPAELLTIANHILGTGQLSLAKFLFITADDTNQLTTHNILEYLTYIFERIHFERDIHFYTNTTIDTLDYSGTGLNTGSKVVLAAYGDKKRELIKEVPSQLYELKEFKNPQLVMPGVVAIEAYTTEELIAKGVYVKDDEEEDFKYNFDEDAYNLHNLKFRLDHELSNFDIENGSYFDNWDRMQAFNEFNFDAAKNEHIAYLKNMALIVICDDANFVAANLNNFLWVTFTRCNPSNDIAGVVNYTINKHWGCKGPLIIDARIKKHHAPPVEKVPEVEKKIDKLFNKGGSLYNF